MITLTTASQTKVYDGAMLINKNVSVSQGSLISGHKLEAAASGYITEPGFAENTLEPYNVSIVNSKGEDVTFNYNIMIKPGMLTVVAAEED
jgi:hypothetical protein